MLQVAAALETETSDAIKPHSSVRTRKRAKSSPSMPHNLPHTPGSERSLKAPTNDLRKRKNEEGKQEGARRKRVKASRYESESQQAVSSSPADVGLLSGDKMRTRRSKRVRREQEQQEQQEDEDGNKGITSEPTTDLMEVARANDEAGDTDEELLSQLMADSQAASQSQSQSRQARTAPVDMVVAEKKEPQLEEQVPPISADDAATAVLHLLRSGKDMLRGKAISRVQVDELETMIMDLKREMYQAEYRGREQ
jgi:hypothetical protein